jgi:DNA-binding PadR family transcriptional regulator
LSRYSGPDTRTTAEKLVDREAKYTAILAMLDQTSGYLIPNEIGQRLRTSGHRVPTPHGHSGKRLGAGSSIVPTLRAMVRRDWIAWTPRTDGLTGTGYVITRSGKNELRRRRS